MSELTKEQNEVIEKKAFELYPPIMGNIAPWSTRTVDNNYDNRLVYINSMQSILSDTELLSKLNLQKKDEAISFINEGNILEQLSEVVFPKVKLRDKDIYEYERLSFLQHLLFRESEVLSFLSHPKDNWIKIEEGCEMPKIKDKKFQKVLIQDDDGRICLGYYYPYHTKAVEFEDWDDFESGYFPYIEEDKENQVLWLRPDFYEEIDCEVCEGTQYNVIDAVAWQPLPPTD
jgi:hypothetical protein